MVECLRQTVTLSLALKGLRRVVSDATTMLLQEFGFFFVFFKSLFHFISILL